jgi:hypothetical protein
MFGIRHHQSKLFNLLRFNTCSIYEINLSEPSHRLGKCLWLIPGFAAGKL